MRWLPPDDDTSSPQYPSRHSSEFDGAVPVIEKTLAHAASEGVGDPLQLEQMLSRAALAEFGREHGLRASDRLIDSELVQMPAFREAGLDVLEPFLDGDGGAGWAGV